MTALGDNPFEDSPPPKEAIDSIELLNTIRSQSRPSWSPEIDRLTAEAVGHGWTVDSLSSAIVKELGASAGPGVTMMLIRRLAVAPPPRARAPRGAAQAAKVHAPCPDPSHPNGCILCYCDNTLTHLTPVPMPAEIKAQFGGMFRAFGTIPDE